MVINNKYEPSAKIVTEKSICYLEGKRTSLPDKTIDQLFDERVQKEPDATSIVCEGRQISYRDLEILSNKLAHKVLRKIKEVSGDAYFATILMNRSENVIISMLALMKAGIAYVPVDPEFPDSRIAYILDDSESKIVLTDDYLCSRLKNISNIDSINVSQGYDEFPSTVPEIKRSINDLAYVLYTSGTTGKPKGVMVSHISVVNVLGALKPIYGERFESKAQKISAFTNFVFDVSVSECFATLLFGNELHLLMDEIRSDINKLASYILENKINTVYLPPAVLAIIPRVSYPYLKSIIYAGEPCQVSVAEYFAKNYRLFNFYGPTETTIYATGKKIENNEVKEIGYPLENMRAYILDENGNTLSTGKKGELHLSGVGVAKGYLNNSTLSQKSFLKNPFCDDTEDQIFSVLYKTGDVVRLRPNGSLEYFGRNDSQIKIKGFRIELQEIEAVLGAHPAITQCLVVVNKEQRIPKLLAYYIAKVALSETELAEWLNKSLPQYMIPAGFSQLTFFPLNINGKIDRHKLPSVTLLDEIVQNTNKDKNEFDNTLAGDAGRIQNIFSKILEKTIHENGDFYRHGGDSIAAMQVCALLNNEGYYCTPSLIAEERTLSRIVPKILALKGGVPSVSVSLNNGVLNNIQKLILHHQESTHPCLYNENITITFDSAVPTVSQVNDALLKLVNYHPPFRMVINQDKESYHLSKTFTALEEIIECIDFNERDYENGCSKEMLNNRINHKFDLCEGPLYRFVLITVAGIPRKLVFIHHHLITDGDAMYNVFVPQLYQLIYSPEIKLLSVPATLSVPAFAPPDANLLENMFRMDLFDSVFDMNTEGEYLVLSLPKTISDGIKIQAERINCSVFSCLLSCVNILLYKFSNQNVVTVGGVRSLRTPDMEGVYGNFLANDIYQSTVFPEFSFLDYIQSVFFNIQGMLAQPLDYNELIKEIRRSHTLEEKLPNVYMTMEPEIRIKTPWRISQNEILPRHVKYPLYFEFDSQDILTVRLEFRTSQFSRKQAKMLLDGLQSLLENFVSDINKPIQDIQVCQNDDLKRSVSSLNRDRKVYPKGNLLAVFQNAVKEYPKNIALVFNDDFLSYVELDNKSNSLAQYLINECKVGKSDLVALLLQPSFETLVTILAVLKCGAAYVPIDPDYPKDRIDFILEDTRARLIIYNSLNDSKNIVLNESISAIDVDQICIDEYPNAPDVKISPSDTAYVIYTSGSTGKPKGVVVTHNNVHRLLHATDEHFQFCSNDVWCLFHSYVFDFSVWEIWGCINCGGKLLIPSKEQIKDTGLFFDLVNNHGLTVLNQTPSAFYNFINEALSRRKLSSLRYVVFGGEALNLIQLRPWFDYYGSDKPLLVNMYGITETTVHVTYRALSRKDVSEKSYIGLPLQDLKMFILDANHQLLPEGVVGELYVSGGGLAAGYLNRPELTRERFLAPPHGGLLGDMCDERLYKTGDLVRQLDDGSVEYIGRNDFQVKIRGYRVELGEVEAALSQCQGVQQSIVRCLNHQSRPLLVAYYKSQDPLNEAYLVDQLAAQLPDHMVPRQYVYVPVFPLTVNGKVDFSLLPVPHFETQNYVPPKSDIEKKMCDIWCEVLGVKRVGVQDDFFSIGGDSIICIRLVAALKKHNISIKVKDIFEFKTVEKLVAERCDKLILKNGNSYQLANKAAICSISYRPFSLVDSLEKFDLGQIEDAYPATHLQQGMLIEGKRNRRIYHNLEVNRIPMVYDHDRFVSLWTLLVRRHELLRSQFSQSSEGVYIARIFKILDLEKHIVFYNDFESAWKTEEETIIDLGRPGLFRLAIIKENSEFTLIFTSHHAIEDGWSVASLISEFIGSYLNDTEIETSLPIRFAHYVQQERAIQSSAEQKSFWLEYLSDLPSYPGRMRGRAPEANEPLMYEISAVVTDTVSTSLVRLSDKKSMPVDTIFLSSLIYLLGVYYNEPDVILGVVVNNRLEESGGDEVFGLHLNTMPFRVNANPNGLLDRVYKEKLDLMEYKAYPYGQMKSDLSIDVDNDVYHAAFNYIHFHQKNRSLSYFGAQSLGAVALTNIPLALVVERKGQEFHITFQAHSAYIEKGLLDRLLEYYQFYLGQFVEHENVIERLLPGEQNVLLCDNRMSLPYRFEKSLVDVLRQSCAEYSTKTAVVFEDQKLCYRDLDLRSEQLACYLVDSENVCVGDVIALSFDRGLDTIVSMLAVLKVGAVYVPVDPNYPAERIRYILSDSTAKIVLSSGQAFKTIATGFAHLQYRILNVRELDESSVAIRQVKRDAKKTSLANIIYTSGTTGNPKGVMVSHEGILNLAVAQQAIFSLRDNDKVLQFSSISFDAATWEIFSTLMFGATLVICSDVCRSSAKDIVELIEKEQVTVATLPPVFLETLDENRFSEVRVLVVAGETTPDKTLRRFQKKCTVINAYGPTETTVCCTYHHYETGDLNTNIGRPLGNFRTLILSNSLDLLPKGVIGKLYVCGAGIAKGYFGKEKLTADRFIDNPFISGYEKNHGWTKLYDTGDLARINLKGDIEYIGRSDNQVKIRGYRVELSEIEQVLVRAPQVKQAVVQLNNNHANKAITAYFTGRQQSLSEQKEKVASWAKIYNREYSRYENDLTLDESDFKGWNSSFSGRAIEQEKMEEWRTATVQRILKLRPKKILEVGGGSGLIFYPLLRYCEAYCVTDFSEASINKLAHGAKSLGYADKVFSIVCEADDVAEAVVREGFVPDVIVVNSVVQYFPGFQYLMSVVEKLINCLTNGGYIFLGDIRDARLFDVFHYDVQTYNNPRKSHEQRVRLSQRAKSQDKELLISPEFFYGLPGRFKNITHAAVCYKEGRQSYEMINYRYDAILSVNKATSIDVEEFIPGTIYHPGLNLKELLNNGENLHLIDVPNPRVYNVATDYLNVPKCYSPQHVPDWEFWKETADRFNRHLLITDNPISYYMNVLLTKDDVSLIYQKATKNHIYIGGQSAGEHKVRGDLGDYVREPAIEVDTGEIKSYLAKYLPEYLIPNHIIQLERIPLTTHGKINYKALPEPDVSGEGYRPPANELEQSLCLLWQNTLHVARVGLDDDFFELGGNSILAITLCHRMSDVLDFEINVAILFRCRTISSLINEGLFLQKNTIPAVNDENPPLSYAQQRLWFIEQYEDSHNIYTIPFALKLVDVPVEIVEKSLRNILSRHEILRTCFRETNGEAQLLLLDTDQFKLKTQEISIVENCSPAHCEQSAKKAIAQELALPFSLKNALPLRAVLYAIGDFRYLFINIHHIAFDGWSIDIFLRELRENIRSLFASEPPVLPKLPIQYKDYSVWQRRYLSTGELARQGRFWKQHLQGFETLLLPTDNPRPAHVAYTGANFISRVDERLANALGDLAKNYGVTLYTLTLSVFNILLSRYSGQQDIVIGSPVANRTFKETENLIGFFVNSQAIRNKVCAQLLFGDYLKQTHEVILKAQSHQDIPFDRVVDSLGVERDQSRHPIFQVMFSLQNFGEKSLNSEYFTNIDLNDIYKVAKYDLTLIISPESGDDNDSSAGELKLLFNYAQHLFNADTIEKMSDHYIQLLTHICKSRESLVGEFKLLYDEEKLLAFNELNRPHRSVNFVPIAELFRQQVLSRSDRTALVCGDESVSFQTLNILSDTLAYKILEIHSNQDLGDRFRQANVVIYMPRSIEMLVAILAVIKAGAAYVPIDIDSPIERVKYIIDDCVASLILSDDDLRKNLKNKEQTQWLCVKNFLQQTPAMQLVYDVEVVEDDLAYIIYTSGTTGHPKGVMVQQKNINNYICNISRYVLKAGTRVDFSSSIAFDLSVTTTLVAMVLGAEIYIYDQAMTYIEAYQQHLLKHKLQFVKLVPSVAEMVFDCEDFLHVDTVLLGGEKLHKHQIDLIRPHCRFIFDEYGPTETTVGACLAQVYPEKNTGIGTPYDNYRVYVLDQNLFPVAKGMMGELYIAGMGVAKGYLNKPELTHASFIDNPFNTENLSKGLSDAERSYYDHLYKTGDLVKVSDDNQLIYLGRVDSQVKLRGYRIELFEVEQRLRQIPGIDNAAVTVKGEIGVQRLVAYYISKRIHSDQEIITTLRRHLPEYMVPSQFVKIPALPLSSNGKVDHKQLPDVKFSQKDFETPTTVNEGKILRVWQEILNHNNISTNDNFFRIGGDSILSMRLATSLRKIGFEITVKDIFTHNTIHSLSDYLSKGRKNIRIQARQGTLLGKFPLLPVQKRFFDDIKQGFIPNNAYWNQSFILHTPKLSLDKLNEAFKNVIDHHDMLKATFLIAGDGECLYQQYHSDSPRFTITVIEPDKLSDTALAQVLSRVQSNFDLESGPLFSIVYLPGLKSDCLFFAAHHLIIDTVSWHIITEDLKSLYEGRSLEQKTTSYAEWVEAVDDYTQVNQGECKYWGTIVGGDKSTALLRKYLDCVDISRCTNEIRRICLNKEHTDILLQAANRVFSTDVNDLLLTALAYGLDSIIPLGTQHVSLEGHGRESIEAITQDPELIDSILDTSRTVGWFTTHFPVALPLGSDLSETIRLIKESMRRVPHKGLGFGAFQQKNKNLKLPAVNFNYLGIISVHPGVDNAQGHFSKRLLTEETDSWTLMMDEISTHISPENHSSTILDVNGAVVDGMLYFDIASALAFSVVKQFINVFKTKLEEITVLAETLGRKNKQLSSPSDFGLNLSLETFDRLSNAEARTVEQEARQISNRVFPANSLQQGFIYHNIAHPTDDAYHVQFLIDYDMPIDVECYQNAWERIIEEYPALRVGFDWSESPVQIIHNHSELAFEVLDIRKENHPDDVIRLIQKQDRETPFDLNAPPLFRIRLIQSGQEKFTLLRSEHHGISDGWSNSLLMARLHEVYSHLLNNNTENLEKRLDTSYIEAQSYYLKHKKACETFWDKEIRKVDGISDISSIFSSPVNLHNRDYVEDQQQYFLTVSTSILHPLATEFGLTLSSIIQCCWHKLLASYTNSQQTIVGTTLSGRGIDVPGIEKGVGLFINTLPLIVDWKKDITLLQQINSINQTSALLNTYSFQSLARLQASGGGRLFQSIVVHENYPEASDSVAGNINFSYRSAHEKINYPLALIIVEQGAGLSIGLKYDGAIMSVSRAKELLEKLKSFIAQLPECLHQSHTVLSHLSASQRHELLVTHNTTYVDIKATTAENCFYKTVVRYPERIAVCLDREKLTYRELNIKSNQLADLLRQKLPIKEDSIIAVMMDRSVDFIIAILAIIKSGAAYVPLDPYGPIDRTSYILSDTKSLAVISHADVSKNVKQHTQSNTLPIFNLDNLDVSCFSPDNQSETLSSRRLAYVIYTSGTTGKPKGVMIEHASLVNLMDSQAKTLGLTSDSKVLQFANTVFDASIFEIFPSLYAGAELHLITQKTQTHLPSLKRYIKENRISTAFLSTAIVKVIGDLSDTELKVINTGGESLEGIKQLPGCRLLNQYGPTESCVCCSQAEISGTDSLPIGKPIQNTHLFVLDHHLQPVDFGVVGELFVAGKGVARGYLNQEELTRRSFIENPYRKTPGLKGDFPTLYRTGDRVVRLEDGNLYYVERCDLQIKIRGYRIEPGEIESCLLDIQSIKQCLVECRTGPAGQVLVAYYKGEVSQDEHKLKENLSRLLPDYMIPAFYIAVDYFPLNSSGKIDRAALPDPVWEQASVVEPSNELELRLRDIFDDFLPARTIGIEDEFFNLGGDSILAISLVNKISTVFDCNFYLADFLEHQSVRKIAEFIQQQESIENEVGEL